MNGELSYPILRVQKKKGVTGHFLFEDGTRSPEFDCVFSGTIVAMSFFDRLREANGDQVRKMLRALSNSDLQIVCEDAEKGVNEIKKRSADVLPINPRKDIPMS